MYSEIKNKFLYAFTGLSLVTLIFGCSARQEKVSTSSDKASISKGTCNWDVWRESQLSCQGNEGCGARVYREITGDIKGGIDCITKTATKKLNSLGLGQSTNQIDWETNDYSKIMSQAKELGQIKGKEIEVVRLINKALEIRKKPEAIAFYLRGSAKAERDDYQGALEDINKAIQIKPYLEDELMAKAYNYIVTMKSDKENSDYYNCFKSPTYNEELCSQAEGYLLKSLELDPLQSYSYIMLYAYNFYKEFDKEYKENTIKVLDKAIKAYDKAEIKGEELSDNYFTIGTFYYRLGETEKACGALGKSLKLQRKLNLFTKSLDPNDNKVKLCPELLYQ